MRILMAAMAGDRAYVAVVRPAASAVDGKRGQPGYEQCIVSPQLIGIAIVEGLGLVQFRVALARCIGAQSPDARGPSAAVIFENIGKMLGMGAVDHVIGGSPACLFVHLLNGLAERLADGRRRPFRA